MASICAAASLPLSSSTISPFLLPLRIASGSSSIVFSRVSISKRQLSANGVVCFSTKPKKGEDEIEGSKDTLADALFSSVKNDSNYLLKVAAGSVGGASAIKYGSILFPDVTRPNIIQGLLMVSLPVMVAVIILLKESFLGNQDEDQI